MFPFALFFNAYSFLICLFFLSWHYLTPNFDQWKKQRIKFKKPIPIFGNFASIIFRCQTFHEFLHDYYTYFKDRAFGGIFVMLRPWILIRDPKIVHKILVTDFNYFPKRIDQHYYLHRKLNPLSVNINFVSCNRWRFLRKKFNPIFNHSKLYQTQDRIFSSLVALDTVIDEDICKGSTDQDLNFLYNNLCADILGHCLFGIGPNSLDKLDGIKAMGRSTNVNPSFLRLLWLLMPTKVRLTLGLSDYSKDMTEFFKELVMDTMRYRREHGIKVGDVFQSLMDLQNAHYDPQADGTRTEENIDVEHFDEIDVLGNAFLFFTTHETVGLMLTFCLYELAMNLDVQNKLRAELLAAYNENNQTININILNELKYLDAVLSETLRKHPPSAVIFRTAVKDYILPDSDKVINKNDVVSIPIWSIHHDEKYYPNPEHFDPMRFYGDNKQLIPKGAYLPFGGGPRMCIGTSFVRIITKITMADALLKYEFTSSPRTPSPITFKKGDFLLRPADALWIRITKRK